jgi:hypothetical protein
MLQISNIEADDNKLTVYFKTDNCYLNHSEIQINTEHSVRQQKINNNDMLVLVICCGRIMVTSRSPLFLLVVNRHIF